MKSVMKSIYLKIIAVVIFMCCFGVGTFLISDIVSDFNTDSRLHYEFESDFKDSSMVRTPLNVIFQELAMWTNGSKTAEQAKKAIESNSFQAVYYAEVNGAVLTNAVDPQSMDFESEYCLLVEQIAGDIKVIRGSRYPYFTPELPQADLKIQIRLLDEYIEEALYIWYNEQQQIENIIYILTALVLLALLMLVYLACVCGEKEMLIDRMYIEITGILTLMSGAAVFIVPTVFISEIGYGFSPFYSIMTAVSVGTAILSGITLAFILSLLRNIKRKTFVQRILIWRIIKRIVKWIGGLRHGLVRGLSFKTCAIFIALIAVYTVCVFLCTVLMEENFGLSFILIVGVFLASCVLIAKGTEDFDKIRTGINEIKNGNTDYKIENIHVEILKDMADSVNTIGDGISKSVEEQIKAERMKSELITNVSHDLKTPLTSIISYVDLLCKEELKPDEANDYAKVIKEKSERLKNLTSDLFDISKVQSGNETIEKELLDISLLISQSVGEADSHIKESGLEFVINIPDKDIRVMGDGKKLSRVFENLVMNAVKYSMKNTRVYIDVKKQKNKCIIEMKNISSYPLNFDCEEITERFVRGDLSRSTEGSGLGLAIAKSYVEACGGAFRITTDGDLFKATIEI